MEVFLKDWKEEDASRLYTLCKDQSLREQSCKQYVYPRDVNQAKECIKIYQHANPIRFYIQAIVYKGEICGWIQCEEKGYGMGELSYWLEQSYRNQGVMKNAIRLMCKTSFNKLQIQIIYARVDIQNVSSQAVLLANNFIESKDMTPIYLYYLENV